MRGSPVGAGLGVQVLHALVQGLGLLLELRDEGLLERKSGGWSYRSSFR